MVTPKNLPLSKAAKMSDDIDDGGNKEVKSAANAELYAFYQSLIPQNSKEKDDGRDALGIRSRSMVTNFMDIPEVAKPVEETKDNEPDRRNSSFGYSNTGTFQTPDRNMQGGNLSPNAMMKDVIFENTAEEDMTPDSEEMIKPLSKANLRERKESFKTHAFESIDSFVQLEN